MIRRCTSLRYNNGENYIIGGGVGGAYNLYSSPIIIWVIKSRRIKWTRHVARKGERRGARIQGFGAKTRDKETTLTF
jgi:hypothetical protein